MSDLTRWLQSEVDRLTGIIDNARTVNGWADFVRKLADERDAMKARLLAAMELEACASVLIDAYARGEVEGGSMDCDDADDAFKRACRAMPGLYEERLAFLQAEEDDDEPVADDDRSYGPAGAP